MEYKSTRTKTQPISSSEAIIKGISQDGGLYVPVEIPKLDIPVASLKDLEYKDLAFDIMKRFFTDLNQEDLKNSIYNAYDEKFDTPTIVPITYKDGAHFLELFHGPTLAFKDMALSILPELMNLSLKKQEVKKEIVILTATSGDTGKAALEGFANKESIKIVVFFPKDGVSEIQKLQMITQEGDNTFVVAIEGNFDDAQSGVKTIFNDKAFAEKLESENFLLSSANSINIGRLVPQIVYYFYGYLNLLKNNKIADGEKINVVVPTGNFGNILAAYYAKIMGLPINKFICASNDNNVLYDFFTTGIYDKNRDLKITTSPSMDILLSSNLERLLYTISGEDEALVAKMMSDLNSTGKYEITPAMKEALTDFYGGFATEAEVNASILDIYNKEKYVIDTHTAVAMHVYKKYVAETNDTTQTLIASTASPFKFSTNVASALGIDVANITDFEAVNKLSETCGIEIPDRVSKLLNMEIKHNNSCTKTEMKSIIEKFLKL
ncbi:threonine synthase [Clostridium cellulovorans]|uniref:Threonine synthase n=1 Tax=Clostridium cellulovorans (strain ATCC 35296 / DSM 3052 / OCM 3 / 743B) TaxID=573061 RepID=D9SSQ6_CLOC7|nr:threonine synthase [Clostridium cellulovorans]ADL52568.1 threonine synthase [Clostridium cellulovorans 743B]